MSKAILRRITWRMHSLLLILTFFTIHTSHAQVDTEFWFAVPEVTFAHFDEPLKLRFASFDKTAKITVLQPANPGFPTLSITLAAGTAGVIDLTAYKNLLENVAANVPVNKGLLIRSTAPVTAYYELGPNNNPELFVLKGKNALGYKFYTPFQTVWPNVGNRNATSSIDIVATANNTLVKIVPTKDYDGGNAGDTITVMLQRGQTYSVRAAGILPSNRLAGTYIESSKPIAVTLKDDSVHDGSSFDLMGDQLVPTDVNGTEYVVMRGELINNNDRVFIMPVEDNTKVSVAGGAAVTANAGATLVRQFTSAFMYITSDKPVYVFHASGFGREMAGALIPPIQCTGSGKISFVRSVQGGNNRFFMNVLIKKGYQNYFRLNGNPNPFPLSAFQPVAGDSTASWLAAHIDMTSSINANIAHLLSNDSADFHLGIMNGEPSGGGTRYGYFSDFTYFELGPNRPFCDGDSVVLDAGFGKKGYAWYGMDDLGVLTFLSDSQKFVVNDSGTYVVEVENKAGCKKADTVSLSVKSIPPPPVIVGDSQFTVCQNYAPPGIQAQALMGHTLGYYFGTLGGAFSPNPNYSTNVAGELKIFAVQTVTGDDCESNPAAFSITINPTPQLFINPPTAACVDTAVDIRNFVFSDAAGTKNYTYWQDTAAKIQVARPDSVTQIGTYIISDSSVLGCIAYRVVSARPKPIFRLRPSGDVCFGLPIPLGSDSIPGYRYEWRAEVNSDINFIDNRFVSNPVLSVPNNTEATLAYAVRINTGAFPLTCSVLSPYIYLNIKTVPVNDTLYGPEVVCVGAQNISFTGKYSNAIKYQWSIEGGGGHLAGNPGTTQFETTTDSARFDFGTVPDTAFIKTIAVTDEGCYSDTGLFSVAVSNDTLITPTPAGPNEMCFFDSENRSYTTLNVPNSAYIWSWLYEGEANPESDSSGGATQTLSWPKAGVAQLWVRQKADFGSGVCYGRSDTLSVFIKSSPDTSLSIITPDSVCQLGGSFDVRLPGRPGSVYTWVVNGGTLPTTDSLITINDLSQSQTLLYTVTETLNGCPGKAINGATQVHPLPTMAYTAFDSIICPASRTQVYAVQSSGPDSRFGHFFTGADEVTLSPGRDTAYVLWSDSINNKSFWVSDTNRHGCISQLPIKTILYDPSSVELLNISVESSENKTLKLEGRLNRGALSPGKVTVNYAPTSGDESFAAEINTSELNDFVFNYPFMDQSAARVSLSYQNLCNTTAESDTHTSIFVSGTSEESGNLVNLLWTGYQGWPAAAERTELWRALEDGEFEPYRNYAPALTSHSSTDGDDAFIHRFKVKMINQAGRVSWSNEKSIVFEHPLNNIPNVFTPNGDGVNDYFFIDNLVRYPGSSLRVFDRWGKEVYRTDDYKNDWNGENITSGVYFYELKPTGKAPISRGYVQLIK